MFPDSGYSKSEQIMPCHCVSVILPVGELSVTTCLPHAGWIMLWYSHTPWLPQGLQGWLVMKETNITWAVNSSICRYNLMRIASSCSFHCVCTFWFSYIYMYLSWEETLDILVLRVSCEGVMGRYGLWVMGNIYSQLYYQTPTGTQLKTRFVCCLWFESASRRHDGNMSLRSGSTLWDFHRKNVNSSQHYTRLVKTPPWPINPTQTIKCYTKKQTLQQPQALGLKLIAKLKLYF